MGWLIAGALAVAAFAVMALVLKAPKAMWTAIGSALLVGLAGYALQANPKMPGAPKQAQEKIVGNEAALIEARQALAGQKVLADNTWMMIADALARHGQYADASGVLLGAIDKDPKNAGAWLALGNALVGHAEGTLTPAALYAFRHAAQAAPDQPGPPFFLGLALAQSGRFGEARDVWVRLLAASPPGAPWRADLAERLQRLDEIIAMQRMQASTQGR